MTRGVISILLGTVLSISAVAQSRSIQGVWKLNEQTTQGKTKIMSQPSMYVFTKKHYSVIYVSSETPRAEIADLSKLTADELRATFVNNFVANAGTYEFKNGKLTMHPMVAKNPGFMGPSRWARSAVTIDGNALTLVSEETDQGPAANPTTSKLTRIE